MYYDRLLSDDFEKLFKKDGKLSWLIPYIKRTDDLDILIGKSGNQEYCSIYRGTSRIAKITKSKNKYRVTAADSYKKLGVNLYGDLDDGNFNETNLECLRQEVQNNTKFDRYYNNIKEGYYQNMFQRHYGIEATCESLKLIVDKEVVIGYKDRNEKNKLFGKEQDKYKQCKHNLQNSNRKKYGKPSKDDSLGNELDLLALDTDGNIHLMELKDGRSTSGIYMSPFQIGLYKRIFDKIDIKETIKKMIEQKQRIGLLPKDWIIPDIRDGYILELVIGGLDRCSRGALDRLKDVKGYIKENDADIYNDICNIRVVGLRINKTR